VAVVFYLLKLLGTASCFNNLLDICVLRKDLP